MNARPAAATVLLTALSLVAPAARATSEPKLETVLERAGAYVAEFHRRFSGIVAEERYSQRWETILSGRRAAAHKNAERILLSDLALVRLQGWDEWLQFRDVYAVDGQNVRDRAERLTKIFLQQSKSIEHQVAQIREESARYNIGDIDRTLNTPLLAVSFLLPQEQRGVRFKRATDHEAATLSLAPDTDGVFRVATEMWTIEFEETARPTRIRTRGLKNMPARGRFWIDPANGRVLMTELRAGNGDVRATIGVSFKSEPLVGMLVPVEMREEYFDRGGSHITGIATYGRFRQFQVNVDEKFGPIRK